MAVEIVGIPQEQLIVYETTIDYCNVYYFAEQVAKQAEQDFNEFLEQFSGSLVVKHCTDNA